MANGPGSLHHEDSVFGKTRPDIEVRGRLLRLSRHDATLQIHDPATPLALSDTLAEVTLQSRGLPAYRGRAVVSSLSDLGTHLICTLQLDPASIAGDFLAAMPRAAADSAIAGFLEGLDRELRILPEFKLAVADVQSGLGALQRWTEQLELGAGPVERKARAAWIVAASERLAPQCVPLINGLFARYEDAARRIPAPDLPAHRAHVQRVLHPIVLCAPFAHRTYHKPLGYAGDYEMVNMMLGGPAPCAHLFAQIFHHWLLAQDSAAAHRNRIAWLTHRLTDVAATAARTGRRARVYNLGCGPCREIQDFLQQTALSNHVDFTLADFDAHALEHARDNLRREARRQNRKTGLRFIRKSIRQLLRESLPEGGILGEEGQFDLVYSAGLFDYLTDTVCRQFVSLGVRSLRPGGTFVCTNVSPVNPNRGSMELILDWHLYYRDAAGMRRLVPPDVAQDRAHIETELTGSNIFLEITQPDAR